MNRDSLCAVRFILVEWYKRSIGTCSSRVNLHRYPCADSVELGQSDGIFRIALLSTALKLFRLKAENGHPLAGWCQQRMLCFGGASRHCFSFLSVASRVIAPVSSNLAADESRQTPIWLKQETVACPRPSRLTAPEERWCRFASNVSSHFKWLPVF